MPFVQDVQPAPDPRSLRKFGGLYTTEQFRATGLAGVRTAPVSLPLLPFSAGITEIESIDLTISEVGGEELARRRINTAPSARASTPSSRTRARRTSIAGCSCCLLLRIAAVVCCCALRRESWR